MNHVEISRLICSLLLNISALVITYTAYEENTLGHAATFLAHISEVVKSHFEPRPVIMQASCVCCVATYSPG